MRFWFVCKKKVKARGLYTQPITSLNRVCCAINSLLQVQGHILFCFHNTTAFIIFSQRLKIINMQVSLVVGGEFEDACLTAIGGTHLQYELASNNIVFTAM